MMSCFPSDQISTSVCKHFFGRLAATLSSACRVISPSLCKMAFFQNSLFKAFLTGQYSDFTIVCRGHEWKVHRHDVCNRSELLNRATNSQSSEADRRKICLNEEEPDVLNSVLYYTYTGRLFLHYRLIDVRSNLAEGDMKPPK